MSTLRATVRRKAPGLWTARVEIPAELTGPGAAWNDTRCSHPEAMQAAYRLLRDLDAQLMDDVHASRAARRTAPTQKATA